MEPGTTYRIPYIRTRDQVGEETAREQAPGRARTADAHAHRRRSRPSVQLQQQGKT